MNPSPVEEIGQTARSLLDILKDQPATVASIAVNAALIVFIFYALAGAAAFRETLIKQNYEYQREVSQLLAKCIIPEGHK
jgi:hypothetical protein